MKIQIDYRLNNGIPFFSIENLTSQDIQLLKLIIEDGIKNVDKTAITILELSRLKQLLNEFDNNLFTHNHLNGRK